MVKRIIKTFKGNVIRRGGSDYLLIDSTMKGILLEDEESFDPEKHEIIVQLSINKDNKVFAAMWIQEGEHE